MEYSDDESMVRVDFFKKGGKWYITEAYEWLTYDSEDAPIYDAFVEMLMKGSERILPGDDEFLQEMSIVCLEPYHEHAHPLMISHGKWMEVKQRYLDRVKGGPK